MGQHTILNKESTSTQKRLDSSLRERPKKLGEIVTTGK